MIATAMMSKVEAKTLKIGRGDQVMQSWEINYQTESS
jgi:hypothetical protein